jgi:cAMP phosphodiesterase
MDLRVLGCHGGETPKHRTSAFVLDGKLAIDAGSLTSGLDLEDQFALEAAVVSHAHLDHIRDLATIADNRCQAGCAPLPIAGTKQTLATLKKHFFNNRLWPDFSVIPSPEKPTIRWIELPMEKEIQVGSYRVRAIPVSHTIEAAALLVSSNGASIAYSGDTGPTDRLWEVLAEVPNLRALLMEVSFPNREQKVATLSGHHTPQSLAADLKKLEKPKDLATLLFHIKPNFQAEVEKECASLKGLNLTVLKLADRFRLLGTVGDRSPTARWVRRGTRMQSAECTAQNAYRSAS